MTTTRKQATAEEMEADFTRLVEKTRAALMRALHEYIEDDLGPRTQRLVPFHTGDLRRSWAVDPPELTPEGFHIEFGYNMTYAGYVHEILDNFHEPPTQAKFLEQPVNESIDTIGQMLLDRIDEILEG